MNLLQWIYNDADIDASRIVWARDLGPLRNAKLMAYFHDRRAWTVDPNVHDPTPQRIARIVSRAKLSVPHVMLCER